MPVGGEPIVDFPDLIVIRPHGTPATATKEHRLQVIQLSLLIDVRPVKTRSGGGEDKLLPPGRLGIDDLEKTRQTLDGLEELLIGRLRLRSGQQQGGERAQGELPVVLRQFRRVMPGSGRFRPDAGCTRGCSSWYPEPRDACQAHGEWSGNGKARAWGERKMVIPCFLRPPDSRGKRERNAVPALRIRQTHGNSR